MTDQIIARKTGSIGRITLNRPKALNALNQPMVDALLATLTAWRDDSDVKAVVVDGEGEKGFCAGGDIRMLAESGQDGGEAAWTFWRDEYRLNTLIQEYPKPYVALIDGITMGGGVGISVHGSHRVAGDRTMLAMPETGIGFHPDVGGAYFLPRLRGETGAWMGLTGARLKTADCLAAGVATHYVPSEHMVSMVAALESEALDDDGEMLEAILERFAGDPGESDLALTQPLIDAAFAGDDLDEIEKRLEGAGDSWSKKQLSILKSKSPTACQVTLAALRKGADLEFRDVMVQDLRVSMRFLDEGSDFYEGVRAVILDKDNAPDWNPGISREEAERWFRPLGEGREQTFLD